MITLKQSAIEALEPWGVQMDKSTQKVMFSSKTGNWATPQEFFDKLNWRFGPFDLDPCASIHNTKCANFYTEAEDGLSKDWSGHTTFVNPPYGRGIDKWIQKYC
jgi:site-specific DNA-methyltransferase (adenine-specific)